jgi:replicative DNA helicase
MSTAALPESLPLANLPAEQRLLGALLHNNKTYDRVAGKLKPEHFAEPLHGRIFAAIARLIERGTPANPVTLKNLFEADSAMKDAGGPVYLARLAGHMIDPRPEGYAGIITDLWVRRRVMTICADGMERASVPATNESAADTVAAIGKDLDSVLEGTTDSELAPLSKGVAGALHGIEAAWKEKGRPQGVVTGISDLDTRLGGLRPGNLYVLAGRPSMGKSSLAANAMLGAGQAGFGVACFSAEMTADDYSTFMLSRVTGIDIDRLRKGAVDNNHFEQLIRAQRDIDKLPILINDRARPSVAEMRAQARVACRRQKLGLIVVDHIGLVRADRRYDNRTAEITDITGSLVQLAKETNTAVLALSQLSREVEKREDKRPVLSDLRDSGSIEQDAVTVMFLYRHEYYLERNPPGAKASPQAKLDHSEMFDLARNRCEVIFAKHRFGPIGKIDLYYDDSICRFGNLADAPNESVGGLL